MDHPYQRRCPPEWHELQRADGWSEEEAANHENIFVKLALKDAKGNATIKEKVAILPILENDVSSYKGTEYLEIYPFVDKTPTKNSSIDKLWINEDHNKYVELSKWLNGELPYER